MGNFINTSPIYIAALFLIAGFILLIKGADFFVEGSSGIARRFGVPSIIIGLTIVAMGTSLPETAVSVTASLNGANALSISNAIGSNIFNTMVVVGICALFNAIPLSPETLKRDIPFATFCALLLLVLGITGLLGEPEMCVGRIDAVVLLILFAFYIGTLLRQVIKGSSKESTDNETDTPVSIPQCLLFIIGGGLAIIFGGDMTVNAASRIALGLGMSETLVGLTIVSIGTSLPELVTSMVAARKNEVDMALGNAIGSNIFNILMVLGIASLVSPIHFTVNNAIDIVILLIFTLIVWFMSHTDRKITRKEGILMVTLYVIYTAYIIYRN